MPNANWSLEIHALIEKHFHVLKYFLNFIAHKIAGWGKFEVLVKAFLACIVVKTFFKAEAKAFIFYLVNIYLISQLK